MAIDTQNKRRSVVHVLPVPDGSITAPDRVQVAWIYSGITIAGPLALLFPDNAAYVLFRDKRAIVEFRDKRANVPFRDKRAVVEAK